MLLTPPNTAQKSAVRLKENRAPRISWSDASNRVHILDFSEPSSSNSPKGSPKHKGHAPTKSVLKPTESLPLFPEPETREPTPEPNDPLIDAQYLARPVNALILLDKSTSVEEKTRSEIQAVLRERIEAYCVLSARIKSALASSAEADASWPFFHPLRTHARALSEALERDLRHVFVDPLAGEVDTRSPLHALPSPKQSPTKKGGMTESQVTYARDLGTITHAALRFLTVVLPLPSVYRVFEDAHLSSILTAIIAIPLAGTLPTPNARKTWALAIGVLQVQKLPAHILAPARDRIICALKRGVEGELGREGKKGSVGDGLKAVHDLAAHSPRLFAEPLLILLPAVLSKLLAPTLNLRSSACMALTSLAWGLMSSAPRSQVSLALSATLTEIIAPHLLMPNAPPSPPKLKGKSPTKKMAPPKRKEPMLLSTLRQALANSAPTHAAQGPIWALCVLGGLIALLGPSLYVSIVPGISPVALHRVITDVLTPVMHHGKSAVRAMACLLARAVTWAHYYAVPPAPLLTPEQCAQSAKAHKEWNLTEHLLELGAGVATFGAIVDPKRAAEPGVEGPARPLLAAFKFVKLMIARGAVNEAIPLLRHFLCVAQRSAEARYDWKPAHLLPTTLFIYTPLLSAEWAKMAAVMKDCIAECPQVSDVRSISVAEMLAEGTDEAVLEVWQAMLSKVLEVDGEAEPRAQKTKLSGVVDTLATFIESKADLLKSDANAFAEKIFNDAFLYILQDLRIITPQEAPESEASTFSPTCTRITLVESLWDTFESAFPQSCSDAFRPRLLEAIYHLQADLVYAEENARTSGACAAVGSFAARMLLSFPGVREAGGCWDSDAAMLLQDYWAERPGSGNGAAKERGACWRSFVDTWIEVGGSGCWELVPTLLSVPFAHLGGWEMCDADLEIWRATYAQLDCYVSDEGMDSVFTANRVSTCMDRYHFTDFFSAMRVLEPMLNAYGAAPSHDTAPDILFDLANDIMCACYPPEPRNTVYALWTIRALDCAIQALPPGYTTAMLQLVQESFRLWVEDSSGALTPEEYDYNIVPLYTAALIGLDSITLKPSVAILDMFSDIVAAPFFGGEADLQRTPQTAHIFRTWWQLNYAEMDVSELEDGWPESIQMVLGLLELCPVPNVPVALTNPESPERLEFPEDDDVFTVKSSPIPTTVAPALVLQGPVQQSIDLSLDEEIPETPQHTVVFPSTPPRRQRTSSPYSTPTRPSKLISAPAILQSLYLLSPRTPTSPSRRARALFTRAHTPPLIGARSTTAPFLRAPPPSLAPTNNKENVSPLRAPVRGSRTPTASPSVLGKRRTFELESDDDRESETPTKSSKKAKSSPDSQTEREEVEGFLYGPTDLSPLKGRGMNLLPSPKILVSGPPSNMPSMPFLGSSLFVSSEAAHDPFKVPSSVQIPSAQLQPSAITPSTLAPSTVAPLSPTRPAVVAKASTSPEQPEDLGCIVVNQLKRTYWMSVADDAPPPSAPTKAKKGARKTKPLRGNQSVADLAHTVSPAASASASSVSTRSTSTPATRGLKRQKNASGRRSSASAAEPYPIPALLASELAAEGRTPRKSRTKAAHKYWVYVSDSEDEGENEGEDVPSSDPPASSDDDPRFGQVTPHHLVSPALRRARQTGPLSDPVATGRGWMQKDGDPPSDDSLPSSSPVRSALARRDRTREGARVSGLRRTMSSAS